MKQIAIILSVIGMIAGILGLILSFGKDSLLAAICAGNLAICSITLLFNLR